MPKKSYFKAHTCNHCAVFHLFSHVWLFVTVWTVACQAPLFMGFSRQEYWSGLPCPPPGIEPMALASPALQADSLSLSLRGSLSISPLPIILEEEFYITKMYRGSGDKQGCLSQLVRKWKLLSRVQLFVTPWTVVHGIFQARILEWVAVPFSRGSS